MKNYTLSVICAAILIFTLSFRVKSQVLQVNPGVTPEEMVEILIGVGVDYDNVVFTGADSSRGVFSGGPGNIGLSNGIILTSGSVDIAPGPNTNSGAGYMNNAPGDADLEALSGAAPSYDACVLEFDFIPFYNYVWFQFVFASEEYPEFVGSAFNDVFGFFLSGPGITGPFTGNSANIALIPGTQTPVSINNVNQEVNSQYYVENSANFIQYDGFTTVLTAEAEVEALETYHIKLAVGDISDFIFDSGVLLGASSFCSSPVSISEGARPDLADAYMAYPNPATDRLNIGSKDRQEISYKLAGQDGRILLTGSGSDSYSVDISQVPSGIYFLTMTGSQGASTRKIFKQ